MKNIIYIFLLLFISHFTFAQQTHFAKYYFNTGYYELSDFIELSDSGFMLVGCIGNTNTRNLILRIDKFGDTIYTQQYLTVPGKIGSVSSFNDSTIIVTNGFSSLNGYFINTMNINTNSGDTSFYHQFGYQIPGFSGPIRKCKDNGYIINNYPGADYSILKIDSLENIQWHEWANMDCINILPDINGGYLACGSNGQTFQPYNVLSLNDSGNIRWQHSYGVNPSYDLHYALGIINTLDSNYIVTTDGTDWHLMKLNHNNGDTIWTKLTDSPVGISSLVSAGNDRCMGLGWQKLYMFDGNGDTLFTKDYAWPLSNFWPYILKRTKDGGFAYSGFYVPSSNPNVHLPALVKTDSLGNTVFTSLFNPETSNPITFYPNPAATELNINNQLTTEKNCNITLTNMQGSIVLQQQYNKTQPINITNLPNGIYIAELKAKDKVIRDKIIIQH